MPEQTPAPPWHILGAGAIGTLLAHRLADAGVEVILLRREQAPGPWAHRLQRDGSEHERLFATRSARDPGPIRRLLVTLKAPAIAPALEPLADQVAAGAAVVLLANGRGHGATLARLLPGRDLCRGVTNEGAWRASPTLTVHAGQGPTCLGTPGRRRPAPPWFLDSLAPAGLSWDPDIDTALWHKLAVNCAINGLSAVYRCRNGELLCRPDARRALDALVHEIAAALRALGQPRIARDLPARVRQVLTATAANRSSMLADALAGRQTEIDSINGYLCARGEALGIALPRNAALLAQVRAAQG